MRNAVIVPCLAGLILVATTRGQTVRNWTSNANANWSQGSNWSGNNRPDAGSEIAQFGTGTQSHPVLNANNYTVRGLRFSAVAGAYDVGDDNGARTLKLGSGTSGFIENLSDSDQLISIATLQFQRNSTISTAGAGALAISSRLTGSNRNLTFDAVSDISVSGNITTGSGTLTKQGTGALNLAGANTYTGITHLDAGAIVLQAAEVFANSGRIDIAGGASLRLNDFSETVARLTGAGTVDFGPAGTGTLTLGAGNSTFAGAFAGSGTLVIGVGATLTLGADFNNSGLNLTLAGGTLRLAGHSLTLGAVSITDDSVIDFGAADSTLAVDSLGFSGSGLGLTIQNWTDAADYFYSGTAYAPGSAPLNQVQFQGWTTADTKWQDYDSQVTPVPEPSTYGAWLVAAALAGGWWRRRRA